MSTIKSSSANLTLNADGSGNDIKFQSNAVEVGSLTAEGVLTATSFAGSGANLTGLPSTLGGMTDVSMDITNLVDGLIIQTNSDGSAPGTGTLSGATKILGIGTDVFAALTSGDDNYAYGHNALKALTTASANIAIGSNTLDALTTENYNIAIGYNSMTGAINGAENNVMIGSYSGDAITTGDNNTAIGYSALGANTEGASNTAVGYSAGVNITSGSDNIAIGRSTFENGACTGTHNTAIGYRSLYDCTSAHYSVGAGYYSLYNVTTGSKCVGLGKQAMYYVTEGDNNIGVGSNAGMGDSPSGSITTGSNNIVLGDNNISNLYCADTSISSSDQRDKADIENFTAGLSFVNQMRPITYRWDKRSWYAGDNPTSQDILDAVPDGSKKKSKQHIGFLSQEIETLEKEIGFATSKDNMLVCNMNEDDTAMGLKYERLVPVLVNAIKELSTANDALTARITTLEG